MSDLLRDPVRTSGERVIWYPSGFVGDGKRKFERCGSPDVAAERAKELRQVLGRGSTAVPLTATLDDMARASLAHLEAVGTPQGTTKQYRSNWNVWVPEAIGRIPSRQADLLDWSRLFMEMEKAGASWQTIRNVRRTVNALCKIGAHLGYFGLGEPFGPVTQRDAAVEEVLKRAKKQLVDQHVITISDCPTLSEVDRYAREFEALYPGYGAAMVYVALSTGMRINEVLALRVEHVDLLSQIVKVEQQLDRDNAWPAVIPPKGGRARETEFWTCYRHVFVDLVAKAKARDKDRGWLFPRHRSRTRWADRAGKLAAEAATNAGWTAWTYHWLRHAYASYSLASEQEGGYDIGLALVSQRLGHRHQSTTQDMYVVPTPMAAQRARDITSRLPGQAVAVAPDADARRVPPARPAMLPSQRRPSAVTPWGPSKRHSSPAGARRRGRGSP